MKAVNSFVFVLLMFVMTREGHADNQTRACVSGMRVIESLTKTEKYDKSARPCNNGKPVVVRVSMYIVSINKVQESDMEFDIQIYFRQKWRDDRLSFTGVNVTGGDYISLNPEFIWEKIWMPDPYFENEKSGKRHTIMKKNELVRLYSDGTVFYSARLTLTLSCPMDFENFPMDKQICKITLLSYSYSTKDIIYKWLTNKTETSVYSNDLKLPQFDIFKLEIGNYDAKYAVGTFNILTLDLHFHRRFAFYLTRNYIPAILITIVSWLSFWVDRHSAPARVGIGITTILTMTTLMIGIGQQDLPVVSYIKALDWYYIGCFVFVFTALCEFAVVNYFDVEHRRRIAKIRREHKAARIAKAKKENKSKGSDDKYNAVYGMDFNENESNKNTENEDESHHLDDFVIHSELSDVIDNSIRKLYPLLFTVFNVVYWTSYTKTFSR